MNCLECNEQDSKVLDTRQHPNGFWLRRRRQCVCGARWWTVEINEVDVTEKRSEE
jgi:transcriptional regulator NrdR family protein